MNLKFILSYFLISLAGAQDSQAYPFVADFSNNLRTRVTTFDAVEDSSGIIYFSNEKGIVRYNGNSWTTIELPNYKSTKSIHISKDNILYVGGDNEIGFVDLNTKKKLHYTTLRYLVPDSIRDFNYVWYVKENSEGIYFQTRKYLLRYIKNEHRLSVIHTNKTFHTLHELDGKIYTRSLENGGLCTVEGDLIKPANNGAFFEYGNSPYILLKDSLNRFIYGTRKHGLFYFENGQPVSLTSKKLKTQLQNAVIYRGISLQNNKGYAIATLTDGVFIIDTQGKLKYHINDKGGLSDSDVKNVFEDTRGNLWLSLNSGVNRIELNSPYRLFDKRHGFRLEPNYLLSKKDKSYIATNNGLWILENFQLREIKTDKEIFYEFVEIDETVFTNSENGIYKIVNDRAIKLIDVKSFDMVPTADPKSILIATHDGVSLYSIKDKTLEIRFKIKESAGNIFNILRLSTYSYWFVNQTGELSHILFDSSMQSYKVNNYPFLSLAKTQKVRLLNFEHNLYTVIEDTIRHYSPETKQFSVVKNPVLPLEQFSWIEQVTDSLSIGIGLNYDNIYNISSNGSQHLSTHRRLQSFFPANQMFPTFDRTVWFGFFGALVIYDGTWNSLNQFNFQTNISEIEIGGDSLVNMSLYYNDTLSKTLSYKDNNLKFSFNSNAYLDEENTLFRSKLVGFDSAWSNWSKVNFKEYTNLDAGEYTFTVESKSVYELIGKQASVHFKISAPWQRSYLGYGLYIFAAILFFMLFAKIWMRTLVRRNEQLEKLVTSRTEQLEQQTEKLKSLNKLKTQFFTNISHEIRTPLTLLLSPFDKLEKESMSAKAHKTLAMMKNNGQRLLSLVNQLLDFSKLEHGRLPVVMAAVDIVELVQHIVSSFQSERTVRFAHKVKDFSIKFDGEKLNKIMYNLISNAVKFSDPTMPVDVELIVHTETFSIEVKDRGIGIADADKDKVFDRFYQVDQRQQRNYEGSGIGLALTKELVQLIGGTISLKSAENFGSTFSVTFPFKAEIAQLAEPTQSKHELPQKGIAASGNEKPDKLETTYTILVAEDNTDLRHFIADIFNDDFKVITVEDGQAALNSLKKSFPDLIISDVMMPKLDGFELLKHIKEDESTSHIPTILLTAKAADQSKIEGLTYGANDYLTKPFSADELKLRVRNQLALVEAVHRQYNTVIQNDEELSNSSFEHPFVRHAAETVVKFIDDSEFDVDRFCYEVGVSRSNLHRKLKSLTGQSTTDLIRQIRLKKAKELLLEYNETVSSVAIQVGFNSLSYFNRQFKRLYQINPSDYRKRNHHL